MFSFLLTGASSAKWAVLYAGSNEFYNYRHQADICAMYQMLKNRGFDDKHLINCQYDDIATAARNPFRGQIFHTLDHVNVYPGASKITYSGKKVTAGRFYEILTTLPSTENDYVYVYYDNHGGPGVLGVPEGCGSYITSKDLAETFDEMAQKKLYKNLFFGLEACYSGSVAQEIKAPNMCVITAANDHESSYAAVLDRSLNTYLTNEFSLYWMNFLDEHPEETIGDIFTTVRAKTQGSHVMFYGDAAMQSMKLSLFLGMPHNKVQHNEIINQNEIVPAYLATKSTLYSFAKASDKTLASKAKIALHSLISAQEKARMTLTAIAQQLEPASNSPIEQPCGKITDKYFEVLDYFTAKYGVLNGDDLPLLSVLVNLSNKHSVAEIKTAIDAIC